MFKTACERRSEDTVFLPLKAERLYINLLMAEETSCEMLMVSLLSSAALA
jgi:hypothetical protein